MIIAVTPIKTNKTMSKGNNTADTFSKLVMKSNSIPTRTGICVNPIITNAKIDTNIPNI